MTRFVTLFFVWLIALPGLSQSLSGTVQESSGQPAAFAALKLLRAADSTVIMGTVSNEMGRYTFTNITEGSYRVQASFVGMVTVISGVVRLQTGQPLSLSTLTLQPADRSLSVVTVRAQKQSVEQQADKTVLNVAADQNAQGKTAYELLQQAPGVVIDPNDNIRMAGKQGAVIFIDGKPTNLSAADVANLLRATPASNIATVELITNPSARFDAQGGAGIINIRFRRDKTLGLKGTLSGGYGQSDHHRANAGLDLNYRARHLSLFGNAALSDNYQLTNVTQDRSAGGRQFLQRGFDTDGTRAVVYKAGADLFFGTNGAAPRHILGLIASGNATANGFGSFTTTNILNGRGSIDSSLINEVNNPSWNKRINTALNYRYADTLGLEINLDADLTRFSNESPSAIASQYLTARGEPLFRRQYRFETNTGIDILTVKGDMVKQWKTRRSGGGPLKLEAGFKHTNVSTDNQLLAFTGADNQPDINRTNRFTYREIVNAGYASLNRSMGKGWTLQAGLRAEQSILKGRSRDLLNRVIDRPDTSYVNLFPTAFVQYRATEKSQLAINYGRRIGRPGYQDLNPFIYQIDPYTTQRGNPFLRPTYTHNAELSYTYKWATSVNIAYSLTNDYATDIVRQERLSGYQLTANVGRVDVLNLSVSTPYQFTKWWSTYLYAGATWNRFRGDLSPDDPTRTDNFDQRAFAFEGYMQHSFTISKVWSGQLSGFWNAPTTQTVYRVGGLGALNLSVQKKVLNERGTITLAADDLLNTMRWRWSDTRWSDTQGAGSPDRAQFAIYRKWESRRVTVRFSYRFGSKDVKSAREREAGSDAERIKTKGNL